jgi:peptidoglycan hydrolase-like amidase
MTRKKFLLIAFLLSLFMLQQTQVGAKFLPHQKENAQANSILANELPTQLNIYMRHLESTFGKPDLDANGLPIPCSYGDTAYGCAELGSGGYTYPSHSPQLVEVETDYLLDVLPREMNVREIPPTLAALQAQALAARSYADFRFSKYGYMDNSSNFQVFIPYSFEFYTLGGSHLNEAADPCNENASVTNSLNEVQQLICDAVTSTHGYYLSQDGSAIDAQFASDSVDRTATCKNADGTGCRNADSSAEIYYLKEVQDPISNSCDSTNFGQSTTSGPDMDKVWGMSQKGAVRWSKGNECANAQVDAPQTWSVQWTDYRQILAHYYTGIDILNGSGSPVAPNYRWNLLKYDSPIPNGASYTLNSIWLQNTSTSKWNANDIVIGYQWTARDAQATGHWTDIGSFTFELDKGAPITLDPLTIPVELGGNVTLHLDLRRANVEDSWFSKAGWPDATIDIDGVAGPTVTPTPIGGNGTATPDIGAPTPTPIGGTLQPPTVIPTATPAPVYEGTLPSHNGWRPWIVTISNLIPGMQYRIVVSGVVHYNSWLLVDPQWHDYQATPGCFCQRGQFIVFNDIPLAAQNGQEVYDPIHSYTFLWLADSAELQMYTSDSLYYDNYGDFTYQIFEDSFIGTPTPTPTLTPTPTPTLGCNFWTWICSIWQGLQNSVQDFFNRIDGFIGENWGGDTGGYSVSSNKLDVAAGSHRILWQTSYGADQFAFITMSNVDENGGEQSLILKSQSAASATSGGIEVVYDAANNVVRIMTNAENQGRVQRGEDIAATFIDGDQFTARARPDGMVEIYRNEQLLGTRDMTAWPYYAEGGYTGLLFVDAGDAVLDDFGGGTVSTDPTPTPTNTPTPTPTFTPTDTPTPTPTFTPTETPTPTPTFTPTAAPLVVSSVTRNNANPTNLASVSFTVTFSETVTGVDVADFSLASTGITGASITTVSGSGATRTVTVSTGTGSGTLRLNVIDNDTILNAAGNKLGGAGAGNGNYTIGQIYTVDKPTVVSSLRAPTNPIAASTVTFTVTFSETVTGVGLPDFNLTTTGVTGASISSVSGSGSVYVVKVNAGSGAGTIRLNVVDDDTIADVAGNKLGGTGTGNGDFTGGQTYTISSLTVNSIGAQDGTLLESLETSNAGGTLNATAAYFIVGDNAANLQYRSVLHFGTASLPDTAVVSSATVKVKQLGAVAGTNPFTTHGNLTAVIQKPYFGAVPDLEIGDFQATAGNAGVTTFGSTPVGSWYSALLNSAGFSYVNLTGTTQFRLAFTLDDNNDLGADYIVFSSCEDATVANRPQLIILYYLP